MSEALRQLGSTAEMLTPEEQAQLDCDGYINLGVLLDSEFTRRMAARLDELAVEEGERAGLDFHTEPGTTRLGSLVNKDPLFDICFLHPRALAAVAHVMGDNFGLSSITGRAAQPGEGHQAFHRDQEEFLTANILWIVSDFTAVNGPTRLVPGSHRYDHGPRQAMDDPAQPHPDEICLIAPAGTCVVINGKTWHSGTRNDTAQPRHLVSAFFTPRGRYQPFAYRTLSHATRQRLSEAALYLVDHEVE